MDQAADLQAQIVALRVAVEGAWLSLLNSGPNPTADAERMRTEMVGAVNQLAADTPNAAAARDAIAGHTEQLWRSIEWQLANPAG